MKRNHVVVRACACGMALAMVLAPATAASAGKKPPHHAKTKHKKTKHKKAKTSTTTTSASTANFNSCSVVTQAEAASAIGSSVTPGVLGNATVEGGLACVFYGPSAPTPTTPNVGQPDSVRVVVVKGSDALTWYNNYKSSPEVRAQPITGYGDQAYYDGYASLSVLKGDDYLRVAVVPVGAPPSLAKEELLANTILPKL
jgi:hypothetical protein